MKKKIKSRHPFLLSAITIFLVFLSGCIDRSMIYHAKNQGEIFLTRENLYGNDNPPFNHPYKISQKTIASMMSAMECNGKKVFSDIEVQEFAPQIKKAFLKADSKSLISFYISESTVRDISGGEIYIKGDKCYWFFYPSTEIFIRSPVIDERLECLSKKKYEFSITSPGT